MIFVCDLPRHYSSFMWLDQILTAMGSIHYTRAIQALVSTIEGFKSPCLDWTTHCCGDILYS